MVTLTDILHTVDHLRQKKKIRRLDLSLSLLLQIERGEGAATRAGRVETVSTGRYSLKLYQLTDRASNTLRRL